MRLDKLDSEFLHYVIGKQVQPGERLPTLSQISDEMGVSVGKLREQLEVARNLGVVSVRPRVGIVRESFSFLPAVLNGVMFGLGTGEATFQQLSQLRQAIETSMWQEAVVKLTAADKAQLQAIVAQAWQKLRGQPIHVPNQEHRQLHLAIFSRLANPFVGGILQAYWDAYEAIELTRYVRYEYWLQVWDYHEQIVTALCQDDYDLGRDLLQAHFELLPATQLPTA